MVLRQHLDTESDETLSALWRSRAERLGHRGIALCIVFGTGCATLPVILSRAWLVAMPGTIVAAFGMYAAVVRPTLGGRWLSLRGQRLLGAIFTACAAVAGLSVLLLVLGGVFGGSIEVMRR